MSSSTNQITICNSALLKVGADVIASITDTKRAAVVCNTLYALIRDEVLRASPWRFAIERVSIVPNATVPAFDYLYQYDIPNDCLRPLKTFPDSIDWIVEGNQILTNCTCLDLIYIYQNTDESSWDNNFCEAFAYRLAMELALSLTKNIPLKQEMEKSYNASIAQARSMNAVTGKIPPLEADIWSSARRGDYYWRRSVGQVGDP